MKKIKYNLTELMAEAEKDDAATKPVRKIISQDTISEMLQKIKRPAKEANQNGKN